jgi:hypothetical protein
VYGLIARGGDRFAPAKLEGHGIVLEAGKVRL